MSIGYIYRYMYKNNDKRCAYVGQVGLGKSLINRINQHTEYNRNDFDIYFLEVTTERKRDILELETFFINYYKAEDNIAQVEDHLSILIDPSRFVWKKYRASKEIKDIIKKIDQLEKRAEGLQREIEEKCKIVRKIDGPGSIALQNISDRYNPISTSSFKPFDIDTIDIFYKLCGNLTDFQSKFYDLYGNLRDHIIVRFLEDENRVKYIDGFSGEEIERLYIIKYFYPIKDVYSLFQACLVESINNQKDLLDSVSLNLSDVISKNLDGDYISLSSDRNDILRLIIRGGEVADIFVSYAPTYGLDDYKDCHDSIIYKRGYGSKDDEYISDRDISNVLDILISQKDVKLIREDLRPARNLLDTYNSILKDLY